MKKHHYSAVFDFINVGKALGLFTLQAFPARLDQWRFMRRFAECSLVYRNHEYNE